MFSDVTRESLVAVGRVSWRRSTTELEKDCERCSGDISDVFLTKSVRIRAPNEHIFSHQSVYEMNGMGLSLSEICCLFCCPPCPSRIAAKLAFLPPEPTYTFEVSFVYFRYFRCARKNYVMLSFITMYKIS